MASPTTINVKCPCCRSVLEIETESGKVLSHRKGLHLRDDARQGEDGLDVALRQHTESSEKLADRFSDAQRKLAGQADRLDKFFDDARRKAAKDRGPDPKDPFGGGKIWD